VLDGTWQFASGCEAAGWIVIRAAVPGPTASARWCLVPMSSVEIVDVWFVTGLRGTGSQDIRVRELFVPDNFTIDVLALRGSNRGLYGLPYMGVFQMTIAAPAIGVARGALAAFRDDAAQRPDRQGHAARQLRYARSAAEVDAAELVLTRMGTDFEASVAAGSVPLTADRVRFKRDASFAVDLCRSAVARLVEALGAHGLAIDNPVQRALRDVIAIASHHGLTWDASGALFGSTAFGLTPTDPMALPGDALT
jgi:alkylation response protein AidB-like acyl-CoA dehydrogenase